MDIMKKVLKSILLLLAICIGFVSCGGNKTDTAKGKILNVGTEIELSSVDTGIATDGHSFDCIAAIIEGLYQIDKDGNAIPAIAESVDVSEDGKNYVFHLRDAKWSNGTPVTAKDFEFAWKRLSNPNTGSEYSYMLDVASIKNAKDIIDGKISPEELGVKAIDDKTLQVELTVPVPFFLQLMAFPPFYPINEDFYNQYKDQYALTPDKLLVNGPFKLTSWNQGSGYELRKNENYYDADNIKIDGINVQIVKDAQSGVVAFEQGDLDVVKLSGELVERYKDSEDFVNVAKGYMWFLSPNTLVKGLENVNLRKAIALSFNKEQIADNILKDGSIAGNFIIPDKLATGPDGKDFRATSPEYLKYNKEEAQKYYNLAKQELGMDKFTFELLFEDTEDSKKIAEFIKSEVESTLDGVILNLKQQPKKSRLQLMRAGDYEVGLTRWGPDYADPMTYLDMWATGNNYNFGKWSNATYDKIIFDTTKGELANKPVERWEKLKEAEKMLMDNAVIAPVYQTGAAMLIKTNVKGIEFHSVGVPTVYKNVVME